MNVSIPDSFIGFISERVSSGEYPSADAFVTDLIRSEANILGRIAQGEPLPSDGHLGRRLDAMLDQAVASGDYVEVTTQDFDEMERAAQAVLRQRKRS